MKSIALFSQLPKLAALVLLITIALVGIYAINTLPHNISQNKIRLLTEEKSKAQRIKQFQNYFDSMATIVKPSAPLRNRIQYTPINWPDFGNELKIVDMTVVFLTSGRYAYLDKILQSFFQYNTYPITKLVIGHDGADNPKLRNMINKYPNITWVITNIKVGQLQALDQAYRYIDTEYFFFAEDDFQYFGSGFIQYSLQALMYDPKLTLLVSGQSGYDRGNGTFINLGPLKVITHLNSYHFSALAFWPSVRRLSDYKRFQFGYNDATFNVSYGKGSGNTQSLLSKLYTFMGYHVARSIPEFYKHIGIKSQLNKYQPEQQKVVNKNVQNLTKFYEEWYQKNNNPEQVKKSLAYLIQIQRYQNMTRCTRISEKNNNYPAESNTKVSLLQSQVQTISKQLNSVHQSEAIYRLQVKTLTKQNEELKAKLSELQQLYVNMTTNSTEETRKQEPKPIISTNTKDQKPQISNQKQSQIISKISEIIVYVAFVLVIIVLVLLGIIVKLYHSRKTIYQNLKAEKIQEAASNSSSHF